MISKIRTDLALEATELWRESAGETGALEGVRACAEREEGFAVSTVEVLDGRGEAALGKPRGRYVTVELDGLIRREADAFERACRVLSRRVRDMLALSGDGCVLVVGLGNRAITADAVGPETVESVMVTRHLREQLPEFFSAFRSVCAIESGVLGTTGMESCALVEALVKALHPQLVVAVDALASRRPDRLCRTVQISDTGIIPGSGVGNARRELSRESLGVPVIALGVPTVVDAATLTMDLAKHAGVDLAPDSFGEEGKMIVTPRDIDKSVKDISKLLGYSLNLALHDGLSIGDVDMFLS
jgi:spore protease